MNASKHLRLRAAACWSGSSLHPRRAESTEATPGGDRPSRRSRRRPVRAVVRGLCVATLLSVVGLSTTPGAWGQSSSQAQGPVEADDPVQVAAQLANVKRLLESSTGAKRVQNGGNELAHKIRQDAMQRHRAAQEAYERGEYRAARQLLEEAAKSMFQAIRILGPPTESVEKKVQDFEGRATSTQALLEALRRISAEDKDRNAANRTVADVEHTVEAARKLLKAGAHDDARRMLDTAYEMAKAAVEERRDGKTLVRSLHFETAEDEYRYELDRNDTHHMLVTVVLQEKSPGAQARELVDAAVQRATDLRTQAEQQATKGAFREAIELLEQSTKELVRAIRGAGLYIPG